MRNTPLIAIRRLRHSAPSLFHRFAAKAPDLSKRILIPAALLAFSGFPPAAGPAEPDQVFEFNGADAASAGFRILPGGFTGAPAGETGLTAFPPGRVPSSRDGAGVSIRTDAGQVAFLYAAPAVETGGLPTLIRITWRASSPDAAVALACLRGDLANNRDVSGSLATNIPASAAQWVDGEGRLCLLCDFGGSQWITPIVQVASPPGGGPFELLLDRMEIFRLAPDRQYSGALFASRMDNGDTPAPASPTPLPETPTRPPLLKFTPTPEPSGIGEIEPNGTSATAQPLGTIAAGRPAVIEGRCETGGSGANSEYTGDYDYYAFETAGGPVHIGLDWSGGADLDLYLISEGNTVDRRNGLENPIRLSPVLEAGRYAALVVSADHPADYRLWIGAEPPAGPTLTPTATPTAPAKPTATPTLPIPVLVSPTPARPIATSTPGGEPARVQETEPNGSLETGQDLGVIAPGAALTVDGNMSAGGFENQQYKGDVDYYRFTLPAAVTLSVGLEWPEAADLNWYLTRGDETVAQQTGPEYPHRSSHPLDAGEYAILIISLDQASDYALTLRAETGPVPATPSPTNTPPPVVIPTPSFTVTPTSAPEGTDEESEPNDKYSEANALGELTVGRTVRMLGRVSLGGYDKANNRYTGDFDYYSFMVPVQADFEIRLTWRGSSSLVLFLDRSFERFETKDAGAQPVRLVQTLNPGGYHFLITSKNSAGDYELSISVSASTASYPNEVSILNGEYYEDKSTDFLWYYVFDGNGNFEYRLWSGYLGSQLSDQGRYEILYPYVYLHSDYTRRHSLEFVDETRIALDGEMYIRR